MNKIMKKVTEKKKKWRSNIKGEEQRMTMVEATCFLNQGYCENQNEDFLKIYKN